MTYPKDILIISGVELPFETDLGSIVAQHSTEPGDCRVETLRTLEALKAPLDGTTIRPLIAWSASLMRWLDEEKKLEAYLDYIRECFALSIKYDLVKPIEVSSLFIDFESMAGRLGLASGSSIHTVLKRLQQSINTVSAKHVIFSDVAYLVPTYISEWRSPHAQDIFLHAIMRLHRQAVHTAFAIPWPDRYKQNYRHIQLLNNSIYEPIIYDPQKRSFSKRLGQNRFVVHQEHPHGYNHGGLVVPAVPLSGSVTIQGFYQGLDGRGPEAALGIELKPISHEAAIVRTPLVRIKGREAGRLQHACILENGLYDVVVRISNVDPSDNDYFGGSLISNLEIHQRPD